MNRSDVSELPAMTSESVPERPSLPSGELPEALVSDDEHEEGEIEDDEDGLQYEDISSDEEFNIRERIAQLERLDEKLGRRMSQISAEIRASNYEQTKSTHGSKDKSSSEIGSIANKENYECISDEEDVEFYLQHIEPLPKPKRVATTTARRKSSHSAIRYANHGGRQTTSGNRQSRSSSSINARRRRGETDSGFNGNESSRRKRKHEVGSGSTRRPPTISVSNSGHHRRRKRRKIQSNVPPNTVNLAESTSDSEQEYYLDRARLQAACSISGRKRKTDKENWDALRMKLSLEKRNKEKQNQEVATPAQPEIVLDDDDEEEEEDEEVLQLRLQALQTKAELKEVNDLSDQQPVLDLHMEEQELRMLALQSAFTKKHQKRLKKRQQERPYSPSDEISLLSPVDELPATENDILARYEDDDIQIIDVPPETVEIDDSSSDEGKPVQTSPSPCTLIGSNHPEIIHESAVENEFQVLCSSSHQDANAVDCEQQVAELEAPPPPIIGAIQNSGHEDEDEESLRSVLLSKMSEKRQPDPDDRPLTPDSMGEEEAAALRDLILSKMNNNRKPGKTMSQLETSPQSSEISELVEKSLEATSAFQDASPPATELRTTPTLSVASNINQQSKVTFSSNLITLIGKQKVPRKKRKKSETKAIQKAALKKVVGPPLAIAAPPPSRTLVKAPIARIAPPPIRPPVIQPPKSILKTTTTKLINNPNKLVNLNIVTRSNSPKEKAGLLESYVSKPVPKMIIQLGNSDSDSDLENYPAPDPEPLVDCNEMLRNIDNASPSRVTLESPNYSPVPPQMTTTLNNQDAELSGKVNDKAFEVRLDQFLKNVRSKIDQNQTGKDRNELETVVGDAESMPVKSVAGCSTPSSGTGSGNVASGKYVRKPIVAPSPNTPLAVRHLPESAQLEYRRLIARMAQLEKRKLQRVSAVIPNQLPPLTKTIINTVSAPKPDAETKEDENTSDLIVTVNHDRRDVVEKSTGRNKLLPPAPPPPPHISHSKKETSDTLVKRVLINNTVIAERRSHSPTTAVVINNQNPSPRTVVASPMLSQQNTKDLAVHYQSMSDHPEPETEDETSSLKEVLDRLATFKEEDQLQVLTLAENRFEVHSKRFRGELSDLISTVAIAQGERQKQYDLENKVDFLKEKLQILERALDFHRRRMSEIFPALHQSHTAVMASRKRSIELNNLCEAIGREVKGESYRSPTNAREEIRYQLKELTVQTKKLKNMKKLSLEEFKQITSEKRQQLIEMRRQEMCNSTKQQTAPAVISPKTTATTTEENHEPVQNDSTIEQRTIDSSNERPTNDSEAVTPLQPETSTEPHCTTVFELADGRLDEDVAKSALAKYNSPLASLKNQSALNIPDGVICPYMMRGECVDRDCKFVHFQ
ncbi:uncharacterized protein LOC129745185 [Uranotaenia lowii]|uniref:uncharacterized protein LOC129745185 n=1 Tax=Uranotaenia lowii TaxID=190385 RepID=UPI00247A7F07|nr:uncharacterized protein LOC129745185 [Uranotaenia lowii]